MASKFGGIPVTGSRFGGVPVTGSRPVVIPEEEDDRTLGDSVNDFVANFGVGSGQIVGLLGSAYGLATGDMENRLTQTGARTSKFWEERRTPAYLEAERSRQAKVDAAEGEFKKAGVAMWETVTNPMLLVGELAKQAPNLALGGVGGAVGKVATASTAKVLGREVSEQGLVRAGTTAATGTGVGLSSADFGQSAYEQLMSLPDEVWLANPQVQERIGDNMDLLPQVKREIATGLAQNSAIAGGLVTYGLNKLPGAKTIEKALGGEALTGTRLRRAAAGLAGETLSEGLEEGATQLTANIAQSQIDPNTRLSTGLGQAAGLGAVTGGGLGLITGALTPGREAVAAEDEVLKFGNPPPEPAEVSPDQVISFARTRLEELTAKSKGTAATEIVDPATGQTVISPGRPAEFLSDNEKAELEFLVNNVSNLEAIGTAYNLKVKVAAEQRLNEATSAADAVQAASDMVDTDIEALEREAGIGSTVAPVTTVPVAPVTSTLAPEVSTAAPQGQGLLAQAMAPTPSVEPTLTLETLTQADISTMPAPERQEFLDDLTAARTANLPVQREQALRRAAETYGRTVGAVQKPLPSVTPQEAIARAQEATVRAQDLPQERTRTAAPNLDALMAADTRGMDLQDREDFNANLAMARSNQPGPVQTAALQRAAEVYGRAVGPVQARTPAAQTAAPRVEVPRPSRLLGKATELYSETDLEALISNNKVPAVTRRGAEVELRARQVQQPPARIEEITTDENFISIPETVSNVAVQPVAGQSAADAARATAQRAMDQWAASQGTDSPIAFGAPSAELEASVAEITDLIGSQWGGRVVAFSDPRPKAMNGVAIGEVAYVNVSDNQAGVQRTALHEFKHTVEQIAKAEAAAGMTDTPAQEFVDQIDSVFDDITEEGKRAYLENYIAADELAALEGEARETRMQELLQDPELRSEMVADFLGNRATDKKFWQDLAKADPTGFEGFVTRWLAAIDNLLATLRGAKNRSRTESARVDSYIRDLNKAKMVAQSALINYRKATGAAPVQAAPVQGQAAAATPADDLAATPEDVVKAEAFEEKYDILPYTSRGQLEIKFSIKESGKYGDHPVLGIPVNKNGTVSLYFPTTNDTAKVVRRDKAIRGATPSSNRVYLTNESSAPKVERFPGLIDQPLGGANVLVQVDPDLVQILTEYPDGRKDFFMPIAEGAAFKAKMTKLFTLNVPRGKGLSPDRTLLEIQKSIATAATRFKEASRSDRRALVSSARKVLRAEHNVGTLLGENGKLEKTRIGDYGLTYDGQSVSSLGLGLASAQKINDKQKLTSCPQSAICEDLCLGETSGQNMLYGGIGQFRSGPRLSQYLKTEAMVLHPEEFTIALMAEIDSFRLWSAKEEYKPAIRLNVTSDFVPKILEPIITAFPDTMFYDYTKMNTDVIAPNHHLTYSSTGASQVVNGETIINPESNWPRMVQRMRNGQNVAMAFTVRNDMPDFVQDEVSGERFQVWNGDNYDARFLDPKPGEPGNTLNKGMIIGLTNKDRTGPTDTAAKRHRGFFLEYDRARDGDTLVIKDQNALKETVARPVKLQFSRKQGDVLARDPRLEQAARGMKEGTVTSAEYNELVDAIKPVTPYTEAPEPATPADIRRALTSDKLDRIGVPSKTLKAGDPVGLRLDIPAYANHGVWVVSVHDQIPGFAAGKSIGYESVASVTNPTFGVVESAALNIASGKPKATIAVMKGDWKPITPKQAAAASKLAMGSKSWVQVGMDPTRHAYFYDRATREPVVSADEAIQVGPLVLAKNPVYGNKEDFRFSRSQGETPSRQRGINVRNDGDNLYADLIVDGEKTMESRNTNSLRAYVGQTVGIIRTGEGPARLIGSVKIGEPIQVDEQEFRELEPEHLVPEGSAFDIKPGSTKFLYPLTEAQRFDEERAVDSRGIVARDVAFSRKQGGDDELSVAREARDLRTFSKDLRSRISDSVKTRAENTRKVDADGGFLGLEVGDTYLTQGTGGRRWRNKVIAKSLSRVGPAMRKPVGRLNPISSEFEYTFDDTVYTPVVYVETIGPDGDLSQSTSLLYLLDQTGYTKMGGPQFSRSQTDTPDVRFSQAQKSPLKLYSALARAAEAGPTKGQAQQWKGFLRNQKGVTPEEIEWSGVEDWLDTQEGAITREQVGTFLAENGVQVGEVVLGKSGEVYPDDFWRSPFNGNEMSYDDWVQELEESGEDPEEAFATSLVPIGGTPRATNGDTKYEKYTVPGGENYREILLTLPTASVPGVAGEVTFPDEDSVDDFLTTLSVEGFESLDYGATEDEAGDRKVVVFEGLAKNERTEFDSFARDYGGTVRLIDGSSPALLYRHSHWREGNVLAHIRLKDRLDENGDEVLFVEEVQSDWGQEGRERGFLKGDLVDQPMVAKIARDEYGNPHWRVTTESGLLVKNIYGVKAVEGNEDEAIASAKDYVRMEGNNPIGRPVPAAPFVQTTGGWLNLALKRVIAIAVEQGYDKVAFVSGEQSAKHYDLATEVDAIEFENASGDSFTGFLTVFDLEGNEVEEASGRVTSPEQIADKIGKELTQKLLAREPKPIGGGRQRRTLAGKNLSVGGEGMKAFYDFIIPKTLNKLLPKLGGTKVETVEIDVLTKNSKGSVTGQQVMAELGIPAEERVAYWRGLETEERNELVANHRSNYSLKKISAVGFSITPEMKDQVMDAGLPMFSRAQNIFGKPMPTGTWQVEDSVLDTKVIYNLQDKFVDTKRVVEAINGAVGQIEDKWDPYLQEKMYHGVVAKQTKDFAEKELKPLIETMGRNKVTLEDFDKYLHNRHAQERNIAIAQRNLALPDAGSGIATADAQAYLAALPPARRVLLEGLARKIDSITKGTRDILIASGLEAQSTIDAWDGAYKKYVPLMREELDYEGSSGASTGRGVSVSGSSSRRAVGSADRTVVDIMANIAMQRERAIVRAAKNKVSQGLYGLALKNPSPGFWLPINPDAIKDPQALVAELINFGVDPLEAKNIAEEPRESYVDSRTGLVSTRVNRRLRTLPNVVYTRVNGKDRFLIFNPKAPRAERMAKALNGLDVDSVYAALTMAAIGTRWFASVNTQYNPIFGVINLSRDLGAGALNLTTTPLADKKAEVIANSIPALRGIYRSVRGKSSQNQWAALWEEFQQVGGQTGFRDQFSQSEERARALQSELDNLSAGNLKKAVQGTLSWLSDYNTSMENAVRLSAYKSALDIGMTKQRAAELAKDLTVNFNKKGAIATNMGALYAFFNASVQGTTRLAQTLKGPAGKKIVYGGLLLGAVQAVALMAAGFEDDEPPGFIKERNLVIPIGDGKYLTWPMPLGFNVIPNVGRIATEWALSGFERTPDRAIEMATSFFDMFNPIGNAGMSMQTILPTVLDPFGALAQNKDWTGTPISREDLNSLAPTPGYLRARDSASWLATELARFFNLASGGTDFTPGKFSPTPEQLEYLGGQITGGVGREAGKFVKTAELLATGEDLPPYAIPLAGRLYGENTGSAAESNRFYENIRQMNLHNNELRGLRETQQPTGEYLRENPEARLATQASRVYRQVQNMRKRKREMLDRNASRESIRLIEQQITNRMQQFNDRVSRIES